ncbi:T9SS type A sorting domain-containing protein [Chryseobacterium sp. Leaf394]|uniref:T9SS type A sorting domain-containing protein n=1 Tax=Chryseobacterium sp. Leaf394 TaxID=1736361 RepID=UPI0006FDB62D|nr:T9SS type A sorting domain-containing protein [Chryseobacterium sp. Leaf394]KQS91815.1 hypothetical protein ASG21_04975 [Chryseobacterium sp. Leaf394]
MPIKTKLLLSTVFGCCSLLISAQSAQNSSGGNLNSASGSISFSTGNVFYREFSSSTGTLVPGTQHSYELTPTLGINENSISLEMKIFPNPVADKLTLTADSKNTKDLTYRLHSATGALLKTGQISERETIVDMTDFPSSTYFFSVQQAGKPLKNYTIIKK